MSCLCHQVTVLMGQRGRCSSETVQHCGWLCPHGLGSLSHMFLWADLGPAHGLCGVEAAQPPSSSLSVRSQMPTHYLPVPLRVGSRTSSEGTRSRAGICGHAGCEHVGCIPGICPRLDCKQEWQSQGGHLRGWFMTPDLAAQMEFPGLAGPSTALAGRTM